ncbi:hypothetical protein CERSUDRAFT_113659 [Gelatoporia subvermispora B]|uniref:Uncharacterized protein n=1 Tax=Ceriporiopsis subvermispora (strain B) TaxID=914234 RepID=M2RI78_CERS8|nr:hypothetical protein CERSUDRAFT_113659 [Gelatoporia subvermispora B]
MSCRADRRPPPQQLYSLHHNQHAYQVPQPSPGQHYHTWYPPPDPESQLFSGAQSQASSSNSMLSSISLWPLGPPDFLLPMHRADLEPQVYYEPNLASSSTPSDTSSVSRDTESPPVPECVEVVCNAPLVAPVPLPYHSPTFLQFDLPDDDEDLSHPPYVGRPHKRKREEAEEDEAENVAQLPAKRRLRADTSLRWQPPPGAQRAHLSQLTLSMLAQRHHRRW